MPDEVGEYAMEHVALTMGEDEDWFVLKCSDGDYEDSEGYFEADVPQALTDAIDAALEAYHSAVRAVIRAAGVDDSEARRAECCPTWVGHESPGRTHYGVTMPGREDAWPLHPHTLGYFDSHLEAEAYIATLADEFLVHYGAHPLATVTKAELYVERGGWRGSVSSCTRCGWDRAAHSGSSPAGEIVDAAGPS